MVLGILALLLISVFGFLAWRNGKKLAKALHDKDRLEEEIKQADVARRIEEEEDKIDAATAVMSSLLDQHLSATVEVTRLEREYERTKQTLDELTSWDAVDEYLNRKRPTE